MRLNKFMINKKELKSNEDDKDEVIEENEQALNIEGVISGGM